MPVIYAAGGNCHVYVDETADLKQALDITINAKCQRPGVCNAAETLLVHQAVAAEFLPAVVKALQEREVKLYVDEATTARAGGRDRAQRLAAATEKHYATEFLDLEMAVKVVPDLDEAIEHIARYGTGHSEAIVTRDLEASRRFADAVDAAVVYINASTRFTDGGVFGLGAEIGISTQKLHARGPLAPQGADLDQVRGHRGGARPLAPGVPSLRRRSRERAGRRPTRSTVCATRPGLRLGIMGGAFDPIHIGAPGHGRRGPAAVRPGRGGLHALRPSARTRRARLAPAEFRYLMVSVATASHPQLLGLAARDRPPGGGLHGRHA